MKEIFTNSDASGSKGCKVADLSDELEEISLALVKKYQMVILFNLSIIFRCLSNKYGRQSFRRFDKEDGCLDLDITISEEEFKLLSKKGQRLKMGEVFYDFMVETIKKYKSKLPSLKLHRTIFSGLQKNINRSRLVIKKHKRAQLVKKELLKKLFI